MSVQDFFKFSYSVLLVFGTFVFVGFLCAILADLFNIWNEPFVGFFAALIWVVCGSFYAPKYKIWAALFWLVAGGWLAWYLVGQSHYPESHVKAYQGTYYPLSITYLGGLLGFVVSVYLVKRYNNAPTGRAPHECRNSAS